MSEIKTAAPLVSLRNVTKVFGKKKFLHSQVEGVRAVNDVSLDIFPGEVIGLVGESGCGKSTLGRLMIRLCDVSEGQIFFDGREITRLRPREMQPLRKDMQMIFQDPYASLNPRMTVYQTIRRMLAVHHLPCGEADAARVLTQVGFNAKMMGRYPHEFSGGQRQRVCIGRAVAIRPRLIVCDEPVSALDVSVQGQVINLLRDLQKEFNLTYLFISHDLSVVRHISDRIVVMYMGNVVEVQPKADFYHAQLHPYSQALLSAVPVADPVLQRSRKRILIEGDMQAGAKAGVGCPFANRCPRAQLVCSEVTPRLREISPGRFVACLFPIREDQQ